MSTTEIELFMLASVIIIMLSFLVIAGAWWIILWSFNFPIMFAWKQVIGVWIFAAIMNSSNFKKDKE